MTIWNNYKARMQAKQKSGLTSTMSKAIQQTGDLVDVIRLDGTMSQTKMTINVGRTKTTSSISQNLMHFVCQDMTIAGGEIVHWQNKKWLVLIGKNIQDAVIQGVLLRLNYNNDNLLGAIYDSTLSGLDEKAELTIHQDRRTFYTTATSAKKRNDRIILSESEYKITKVDDLSFENIHIYTLEETYKRPSVPEPPDPQDIYISGADRLRRWETIELELKGSDEPFTWEVIQNGDLVQTNVQDNKLIVEILKLEIGKEVIIQVPEFDVQHTIIISSL